MAFPQWYLGAGLSRKGENLDDILVGWVSYYEQGGDLKLHFKAKEQPNLAEALKLCQREFSPYVGFCIYYSTRGPTFYAKKEWQERFGLLSEEKGRLEAYDPDRPDRVDQRSTRLAADVEKLRQAELEWPTSQMSFDPRSIRGMVRTSELLDEPGRGPLLRVLTKIHKMEKTDYVPVAAMALQALRRVWADYGDGFQDEDEPRQMESSIGLIINHKMLKRIRDRIRKKELDGRPEMPDPQLAFDQDEGFVDYEDTGLY